MVSQQQGWRLAHKIVIFLSKYFLRLDLNDDKVLQARILTGKEFQMLVPEKAKLDLSMSIRVLGIRYFSD
jgi:hypothetical protein